MPQFAYNHPVAFNGQVAEYAQDGIRSYQNALVAQQTEVQWAGTGAAGDYTVRIVGDDGTDVTVTYTSPGAEADINIMAGITAAIAAEEDLLNVVPAADDGVDTNELDFIHPNIAYEVTTTAAAGAGTVTEVLAPGGTRVEVGLVVVQAATGDRDARLPTAGDTAADAVGITVKSTDTQFNTGRDLDGQAFRAGSTMAVLRQGSGWVFAEDTVVVNDPVFFRITAPTLATEQIGRVRSDADGGDAVALNGARFLTSAGPGELVKVAINLPANA